MLIAYRLIGACNPTVCLPRASRLQATGSDLGGMRQCCDRAVTVSMAATVAVL